MLLQDFRIFFPALLLFFSMMVSTSLPTQAADCYVNSIGDYICETPSGNTSPAPVPAGVVSGGSLVPNWAAPPGLSVFSMKKEETFSQSFTTTGNPDYAGQIATAVTSTDITYRTTWISSTPGGAPLSSQCRAAGGEVTTLHWSQGGGSGCALQPNTTYYFNTSYGGYGGHEGATGNGCLSPSCSFQMMVYTNQNP